jgi:cytochrome oxidase Cu insertion factor (SCO1/SenC/PrrC family)
VRITTTLTAITFVFLTSVSAFARGNGERIAPGLVGNILQHPMAAADFTLIDQHGATFHMADTRGRVVLMTFLYTHCTDICPFEAAKVKDVYSLLGSDANTVVFVTVTTDPKRDVPLVTAAYSKALGLFDVWHFVGGPMQAVQKVWTSYGIGVSVDPATGAVAPEKEQPSSAASTSKSNEVSSGGDIGGSAGLSKGLSEGDMALAGDIIQQFGGGYDVGHSAPFWIVDKRGFIQVGLDGDALPAEIVTDIRVLLAQK